MAYSAATHLLERDFTSQERAIVSRGKGALMARAGPRTRFFN